MHPEMMFQLTKFRMEELHKEAARQRLASGRSRIRTARRASKVWGRLGFGLRSKTA